MQDDSEAPIFERRERGLSCSLILVNFNLDRKRRSELGTLSSS